MCEGACQKQIFIFDGVSSGSLLFRFRLSSDVRRYYCIPAIQPGQGHLGKRVYWI